MKISTLVSAAYSLFNELNDEVGEVVDNAQGTGRENTGRIQILSDTRDTLDSICGEEPEVPEGIAALDVNWTWKAKKRPSRADRLNEAVAMLEVVIDAINMEGDAENPDEEMADFIDALQQAIDEASNCEFPGIYG